VQKPSQPTLSPQIVAAYQQRFYASERSDDLCVSAHARFFQALEFYLSGASGQVSKDGLDPVATLTDLQTLPAVEPGLEASLLNDLVVIKLNGGLGTSMGLAQPKGILDVKPGLSFIDIAVRQILALRKTYGVQLPLLLMNSFYTSEATLRLLENYPEIRTAGLPLEFLQSQIPKIDASTDGPVSWPLDSTLEWCPPGHGEIYFRLIESGLLKQLKERGFRWAFISNIDNLGAEVDLRVLQWCKQQRLDFVMEATPRTVADRKGGHLATRRSDGRLILRERAQCPPHELEDFEDIERHGYFNTNNLWINLDTLQATAGHLSLPVIINCKTVDPTRSDSPKVVQLESAMGAAIESFPAAAAISVNRRRFVPTKNLEDLLLLRSDLFGLGPNYEVLTTTEHLPAVRLDPSFYGTLEKFEERFRTIPSLLECESLHVQGDVHWEGAPAKITGRLEVKNTNHEPLVLNSPGQITGELCKP
jgi:UTP--glucose-1-phosphate uridylyltransferase